MANAFNTYQEAKRSALQQGAQMLAMDQMAEKVNRERAVRNALSQAYVSPQAGIPMEQGVGPARPAQAGGMDWEQAMAGAAEKQVIPEMIQLQAGMTKARGTLPSSIREWQAYQQMGPEDQKRFLSMKRASQFQTIGGVPTQFMPGQPPAPLSTLEQEAGAEARIAGEKSAAIAAAKTKAKKLGVEPKALMTGKIIKQQTQFVSDTIDKAIEQTSGWTAGVGAMTAGFAGTPAKDLSETLNTIRANIGFDRLQQMREASPTGGALGQVSEMENKLLQAVWGSLEQSQSPSQLKENLKKAKIAIRESWKRTAAAYEQDYGKPMPMDGETPKGEWGIKKL